MRLRWFRSNLSLRIVCSAIQCVICPNTDWRGNKYLFGPNTYCPSYTDSRDLFSCYAAQIAPTDGRIVLTPCAANSSHAGWGPISADVIGVSTVTRSKVVRIKERIRRRCMPCVVGERRRSENEFFRLCLCFLFPFTSAALRVCRRRPSAHMRTSNVSFPVVCISRLEAAVY